MSLITLNGMAFDITMPHEHMIATLLAGIAECERELTQKRIRSGMRLLKCDFWQNDPRRS